MNKNVHKPNNWFFTGVQVYLVSSPTCTSQLAPIGHTSNICTKLTNAQVGCVTTWMLTACMRELMLLAWETFRRLFATTRCYLLHWQHYSSLKKKQQIVLLLQGFTKLQKSTYALLRICSYVTGQLSVYSVFSLFNHYVWLLNLPISSTCRMFLYRTLIGVQWRDNSLYIGVGQPYSGSYKAC